MTRTLSMACWDYDRTRPLVDRRVVPEGFALDISLMRPRAAFNRMLESDDFDLGEVSLSSYVRLTAQGDRRFVGLPVPLSKMFRHSCIYVRAGSGITRPQDLIGKRVGAPQLDSTGIVFIKGMLSDEFGIRPEQIQWVLGGLEAPASPKTLPQGHGKVEILGEGDTLVHALDDGRLDAVLSNHLPSSFRAGSPRIHRLFTDFKAVERDYFVRTGILPVMHVIVIRERVHRADPGIAQRLYHAFRAARDLAVDGLYDTDALRLALPWLIDHVEEARRTFGMEFWSYGLAANRKAFEAICRYQVEQGFAPRLVRPEELFVEIEEEQS
jgi:4,5-dihydroxyphthalate decarboxylase